MKRLILSTIFTISSVTLSAQNIILTPAQEDNWQIEVETPLASSTLPLGEFVAKVVTPPSLLHTISLPFEANVKRLSVANYQPVKKGDILAEVTGTEWIATQQRAIADIIEFKHHQNLAQRKNMLCKEKIIPQKECLSANAELEADKIKVSASKALLESYGASESAINHLFKNLKLSQTIKLRSATDGRIVELHATPGKSTSPSDALFVIKQKGDLWIESSIEADRTYGLFEGQSVQIMLNNHKFDTTIIQLSPVINPQNQTRLVRFLASPTIDTLAGLRTNIKITISQKSMKINKKSLIKDGNSQIVFVKTKDGYNSVEIEILAEDENHYFIKPSSQLTNPIATSSLAILKNMLGGDDE